jgi:hypothetical protein
VKTFDVTKEEAMCTEPMLEVLWTNLDERDKNGIIVNYTVTYWREGNVRICTCFEIDHDN